MTEHLIIVGGGVIGLSCALECRQRGYQVTVLEAEDCGGQASKAAAGMIAPFSEHPVAPDPFYELCVASWRLFPDWIRQVSMLSDHPVDYHGNGSLYAVFHEADIQSLESRMFWQQKDAGRMEILSRKEVRRLEPGLSRDINAALYIPGEGHVDTFAYLTALIRACMRQGVTLIEQTGQVQLEQVSPYLRVRDRHGRSYEGDRLILSTGAWAGQWAEVLQLKIPVFPIRGQVCAFALHASEPLNHLIFSSQGYFVKKAQGRLIQGATEDHAGFHSDVTEVGIQRLMRWGPSVLPSLLGKQPVQAWAGLRPATQDGWPLLGEVPGVERIILAAGHYRNGILLSPVTAKLIADWIEHQSEWAKVRERTVLMDQQALRMDFAPERFHNAQPLDYGD